MRDQWRLLLLRYYTCSPAHFTFQSSSHFQVHSLCSLSSNLSRPINPNHPLPYKNPLNYKNPINPTIPICRNFSSEPVVEEKKDPDFAGVVDIFENFRDLNDIKRELDLNGVVFTHETVLNVLRNLDSSPDVARRFFDWVSENDNERLSSKSYNLMLRILGVNGFLKEFWDLVHVMKKKGFGVSGYVRDQVKEKFEKEGCKSDLERLSGIFATGSTDNSIEKISSRISKIVKSGVWGDDVEKQILELNVVFSSDLVKMILQNLGTETAKALIFFRWIEEGRKFKHDEQSYNAMARVLGREDCIERFWKVVDEMRNHGHEMEIETYVKVLGRFVKRKMIKDAVDLYEFAMVGKNKPSVSCCIFLLRKIVVGKKLDMGLFSRVVRIYTGSGNALTDSMLDAVLKSLTSVGRLGDCTTVLKEMEEGGLVTSNSLQGKIAFRLCSSGKKDKASELVDYLEASGSTLGYKTWASLVEGHCVAGDLEKASDYFLKMVEKEGASCAGYAFELLIDAYCRKNRVIDACKLLHNYVRDNQLKPWNTTYKLLIKKLLVQGGFEDALNLLGLMKDHGFPPYVDPFIEYVSKSGTSDHAIDFLKAMTSKRFPSTSVVLRMFEAFFQAGRCSIAQDVLSKCPGYIRNHADVLNLFCSMNSSKGAATPVVGA
ncbi:PPR domain-containing protein [Cephalotus follicularis]|uniref:PPR domain-containing protein n=1 Tax=Cephalotus follicularis TaxID=3775 RepID=A0A1Q3AWN1_CEPFO|nr:PPR domain-containing protein [Cephalotus follicularis]